MVNQGRTQLNLVGIIYFGSDHFTTRIIDHQGPVWFHDGIATGRTCVYDGPFNEISKQDLWARERTKVCAIIYENKA
ncbi:hypothetical protein K439DRAFT_1343599 [Ramaria rubella]|nr:hypothetical protein K439DRAFT_1343599 [Ramaria rubella]